MPDVVRIAKDDDRSVMERLWLMFRHDLSEFDELLPNPDGSFRDEWLHQAFTDDDRVPYLITCDDRPAGLAFVRGLAGPTRVLNSFFIVRGVRRRGIGLKAVQEVLARHPGPWEIAFQDTNVTAVHFWRRVATQTVGDAWTEDRRPVPGRPNLPPDVWISFNTPAEGGY
ncbi:GNAT family N-acetyltransferase [Streptomyces sp. NRRL WC-3742]|uniref:GNAT family N-acetyltransferase n=1 Tax=Streptomyces sp. NRRL WC-3742 TaxID=1463934 RepID=UPI0004CB8EA7|nr:GNAT family N-acetyltransferase [Streptomyces sp. NRRL WC-3742]